MNTSNFTKRLVILTVFGLLAACGGDSSEPPLAAPPIAAITAQPTDQSVVAGTAATFSVVATNASGYQWQSSTDGGASFTNVSAATNASHTTAASTLPDSGTKYRVVVVGAGNSVTSLDALLTVTPPVAKRTTPAATAMGAPTGSAASATIGAAGGKVGSPDGKITLSIPAGALAADTVISIEPLTNMAHGKIGAGYRLTPEGQTFLKPVTLTFSYTDQDLQGTAAEFLGAAFQTKDGFWQWGGEATVDTAAKTVSVSSSHFSDWSMVKGIQIHPASKTVKTNGRVSLEVTLCYDSTPVLTADGIALAPLVQGYECGLGALAILNDVSEWSVNGGAGGSSAGTVSGTGSTAIYTAPAIKPSPNIVAVSARVDRGLKAKTLVVSNITIVDEDSWTGTGSFTTETGSSSADVTWILESRVDNIALYVPTGTAVIASSKCSIAPSSGQVNPSQDGVLYIDYNANPPTYHGVGSTSWLITLSCPRAAPIHGVPANAMFFGGNKGLGVEAVGVVSADGMTIEGSSPWAAGVGFFKWKFTRNQ